MHAPGERPVEEREAGSLGTGRATGDPTMFAFDTDYDVITPSGGELLAELGFDTASVQRRAGRRPGPALPRPRGPGGPEVEGSERRVSGKGLERAFSGPAPLANPSSSSRPEGASS